VLLTNHGGACRYPEQHSEFCINGTCLMDHTCQCTSDTRYSHGDYYADRSRRTNTKLWATSFFSCWYDPNRMDEMVDASNSLWLQRSSWSSLESSNYSGWNECPSTRNVGDRSSIDAIVIQTPPVVTSGRANLCHQPPPRRKVELVDSLKRLHRRYGHVPVLFLGQGQGMKHATFCDTYWKGVDCDNGVHKWFFAQSFNFSDGSCLAKPEKCKDVYYFPDCRNVTMNPCLQITRSSRRKMNPSASVMFDMIGEEPYQSLPSHSMITILASTLACFFFFLKLSRLSKRFRFRLSIKYRSTHSIIVFLRFRHEAAPQIIMIGLCCCVRVISKYKFGRNEFHHAPCIVHGSMLQSVLYPFLGSAQSPASFGDK
jgi:hypothetical protein